jgi:hypothetical protein
VGHVRHPLAPNRLVAYGQARVEWTTQLRYRTTPLPSTAGNPVDDAIGAMIGTTRHQRA